MLYIHIIAIMAEIMTKFEKKISLELHSNSKAYAENNSLDS